MWVHQADIDDSHNVGTTTVEATRVKELEQEVELARLRGHLVAAA